MKLVEKLRNSNWDNIALLIPIILFGVLIFYFIESDTITFSVATSIATNIFTINGLFSAILITYLFTRMSWVKERKYEAYQASIGISQKITDFRRMLYILTLYYGVWKDDKKSKILLDSSKYRSVDFYDFRLASISNYEPYNKDLIANLTADENFSEGQSVLYLAMIYLVKQRGEDFTYQEELYKDYAREEVHNAYDVNRWLECGIMDSIAYWSGDDYRIIDYYGLRNHFDEILQMAGKVNAKYLSYTVDNKLIRELAEDMAYYLGQLHTKLEYIESGLEGLNFVIVILVISSLSIGVLMPLFYFLVANEKLFLPYMISFVASMNASLILYFVLKFPFMISQEIKWK